jgi:hypothetical protein
MGSYTRRVPRYGKPKPPSFSRYVGHSSAHANYVFPIYPKAIHNPPNQLGRNQRVRTSSQSVHYTHSRYYYRIYTTPYTHEYKSSYDVSTGTLRSPGLETTRRLCRHECPEKSSGKWAETAYFDNVQPLGGGYVEGASVSFLVNFPIIRTFFSGGSGSGSSSTRGIF